VRRFDGAGESTLNTLFILLCPSPFESGVCFFWSTAAAAAAAAKIKKGGRRSASPQICNTLYVCVYI
jgi:hypothetical protein